MPLISAPILTRFPCVLLASRIFCVCQTPHLCCSRWEWISTPSNSWIPRESNSGGCLPFSIRKCGPSHGNLGPMDVFSSTFFLFSLRFAMENFKHLKKPTNRVMSTTSYHQASEIFNSRPHCLWSAHPHLSISVLFGANPRHIITSVNTSVFLKDKDFLKKENIIKFPLDPTNINYFSWQLLYLSFVPDALLKVFCKLSLLWKESVPISHGIG